MSPEKCEKCGVVIEPVQMPSGKWQIPKCECEVAAYEAQQEANRRREAAERIGRLFKGSGLGARFKECSFENFRKRPGTEKVYAKARGYAEDVINNIQNGKGLIIFGDYGNGKSHLAAAITNMSLQQGFTVIFERVPKLLTKIRATYQGGEVTEYQIFKALTEADLLTLDDAGAEKWTEWTEPTLYTIIDERYTNNKAIIITTNSDLDELEKKVGPRAMDRLLEMCEIVENKGTSFRKERARTRKN